MLAINIYIYIYIKNPDYVTCLSLRFARVRKVIKTGIHRFSRHYSMCTTALQLASQGNKKCSFENGILSGRKKTPKYEVEKSLIQSWCFFSLFSRLPLPVDLRHCFFAALVVIYEFLHDVYQVLHL